MKYILLLLLLIPIYSISQQKHIEITNNTNGKKEIIKNNKRIKVVTKDGVKLFGYIEILDSTTIVVNNNYLKIKTIDKIKSRSLGKAIVSTGLITCGTAAISLAPLIGLGHIAAGYTLAGTGVTAIVFGSLLPNLNENHKSNKWKYKIIIEGEN